MNNTFNIFERNTSLVIFTKSNLLIGLMIISAIIASEFKSIEYIFKYITVIILIINLAYFYTESNRYQILNGKIIGELSFNSSDLIVNNRKIEISEIKKIYLRTNDYKGKCKSGIRNSFTTRMSNGTNNLLDVTLKSGEKIKCFFQIEFMQQEFIKPFVISLLKNNVIPFEDALKILHLDEDYKVNLFQLELNKKAFE